MKPSWPILVIAACFAFAGTACPEQASVRERSAQEAATRKAITTRKLSIDLKGVPFHETLEMLTSQAGVGLALDGQVTAEMLRRPLTLKLKKSSIYAVLHWIFRKRNLAWGIDGREIIVAPPEFIDVGVRNRQSEFATRTEKEWKEQALPGLTTARMSVDVADVPLARILNMVAEHAGLSVVWDATARRHRRRGVTLKTSDTPVREILDRLTAPVGLGWSLEAEAVLVSGS